MSNEKRFPLSWELKMPKMGESITEGTIINWLVNEGDSFEIKYNLELLLFIFLPITLFTIISFDILTVL